MNKVSTVGIPENTLGQSLLTFGPEFHMYTYMHAFAKLTASHHMVKVHDVTGKHVQCTNRSASRLNEIAYFIHVPRIAYFIHVEVSAASPKDIRQQKDDSLAFSPIQKGSSLFFL